MITSASNEQIKNVITLKEKSKARKEADVFIVEGIKMFLEIPQGDLIKSYASESFMSLHKNEPEFSKCIVVKDNIFKKISDTVAPQGILALVKQKHYSLEQVLGLDKNKSSKKKLVMILEDVRDPGNLGTILRTAEGAGVTGIVMSKETVDLYNPKVIRSTMGSIYRMPFYISDNLLETVGKMQDMGFVVYAAHLNGKQYFDEINYPDKISFIIGNEARGISDELSKKADCLIKIPMAGKVESLNAAMAAGILMYGAKAYR